MSKRITYYTMALYTKDDEVTSFNICDFLNKLEDKIKSGEIDRSQMIGDKQIKIFKYIHNDINGNKRFIIPFGTLKNGVSYSENDNGDLSPSTAKLYDITLLLFDATEGICVLTSDLGSPTNKSIQIWLNRIINNDNYILLIDPILYNPSYENLKNANQVKTVRVTLDLSNDEEKLYKDNIQDDDGAFLGIKKAVDLCKNQAKAKTFSFEIKLENHAKKNATMNVNCVFDIISKFNIQSEIIKEIEVEYRNNTSEKFELAKLKESRFNVIDIFNSCKAKSLTAEYLLENIQKSIDNKRRYFAPKVRELNRNAIDIDIEIFKD